MQNRDNTMTNEATTMTMHITARFFALYRDAAGQDQLALTVPAGTTVDRLWPYATAELPRLTAAQHLTAYSGFAVNGRWTKPGHPLQDGDEVAFLPPVSGG
jgi:molybdopterin converting factor small subunit